jgi:sporulation protein YlmC with PRC-barrel domain
LSEEYRIQELLEREVYVGETRVGVITGERFHPRDELVRSMRIRVEDGIAEEYMRKPAEFAPLSKELVHSIRSDGGVKLSKSMRELQRRWRNTVRINEKLYAPDELLDRAVLDNDGLDLGNVTDLVKIKRTYKGLVIKPHYIVRTRQGLPDTIIVPVGQLARTTARLDEIILRCSMKRLVTLPSYLKLNGQGSEEE